MRIPRPTRRSLLRWIGSLALLVTAGCPNVLQPLSGGVIVFRRSGRRLRISNAAKKHNANRLYLTAAAAAGDLPHPGDISRVVQVVISSALAARLFPSGKMIADLRHDL